MRCLRRLFVCLTLILTAFPAYAQTNAVVSVNAANYSEQYITFDSIVAAFGGNLANTTAVGTNISQTPNKIELPTMLGGTTVQVAGLAAPLFFVSPTQVNYLIPPTLTAAQLGVNETAEVVVRTGSSVVSRGSVRIQKVAIALYTFDGTGRGIPAGFTVRVKPNSQQVLEPLGEFDQTTTTWLARPIDLSIAGDRMFLVLYASGLRRAPGANNDGDVKEGIRVIVNGQELIPSYAGPQPALLGLDQINVELPPSFNGQAILNVQVATQPYAGAGSSTLQVHARVPSLANVTWVARGLNNRMVNGVAARETVLVAGASPGLFRSLDNGQTWTVIPTFEETNISVLGPAFRASDGVPGRTGFGSIYGEQWDGIASADQSFVGRTIQAFGGQYTGTDSGLFFVELRGLKFLTAYLTQDTSFPAYSIKSLIPEPKIGQALVGTQSNGLFASSFSGSTKTWRQLTQGIPTNAAINALAVNGNYVFAAVGNSGFYRSGNYGAAWAQSNTGLPANVVITALAVHGQNVLAGTQNNGVYVSNDYGQNWRALNNGLNNLSVKSLWIDNIRLIVGTANGAYIAPNYGYYNNVLPGARAMQITTDEDTSKAFTLNTGATPNPQWRYVVGQYDGPSKGTLSGNGLNVTYTPKPNENGADSFTYTVTDGVVSSIPAKVDITINPINDPPILNITVRLGSDNRVLNNGDQLTVFANLAQRFEFQGFDVERAPLKLTLANPPAGSTLAPIIPGSENSFLFNWTPTVAGTYRLAFTLTEDNPAPISVTSTITVNVTDNPEKALWTATGYPEAGRASSLLVNGNRLLVNAGVAVLRSVNNGVSWIASSTGLPGGQVLVTRLAQGDGIIYATVSDSRLFRSTDDGQTWSVTGLNLPSSESFIVSLVANGDKVLVGTFVGTSYLSINRGNTWQRFGTGLPISPNATTAKISSFTLNSANIFVAVEGKGVYRTSDNGASWMAINNTIKTGVLESSSNQLQMEPSGLFLLSTYSNYRSADQGATWVEFTTPVSPAFFTNQGSDLYVTDRETVWVQRNGTGAWYPIMLGLPTNFFIGPLVAGPTQLFSLLSQRASFFVKDAIYVRPLAR